MWLIDLIVQAVAVVHTHDGRFVVESFWSPRLGPLSVSAEHAVSRSGRGGWKRCLKSWPSTSPAMTWLKLLSCAARWWRLPTPPADSKI